MQNSKLNMNTVNSVIYQKGKYIMSKLHILEMEVFEEVGLQYFFLVIPLSDFAIQVLLDLWNCRECCFSFFLENFVEDFFNTYLVEFAGGATWAWSFLGGKAFIYGFISLIVIKRFRFYVYSCDSLEISLEYLTPLKSTFFLTFCYKLNSLNFIFYEP